MGGGRLIFRRIRRLIRVVSKSRWLGLGNRGRESASFLCFPFLSRLLKSDASVVDGSVMIVLMLKRGVGSIAL